MDLAGEEKRIQALFSEASLQDRSTVPSFKRLWASAEIRATRTAVRISGRFVFTIASVVLIVATATFGAWSFYKSVSTQHNATIAPQPVLTPLRQPPQLVQQSNHASEIRNHARRQKRFTRAPQMQRSSLNEAALLSRWQSPTQLLMQFSKTVDLSSLPQLNQSAEALKQFLPANADLKKESNQ